MERVCDFIFYILCFVLVIILLFYCINSKLLCWLYHAFGSVSDHNGPSALINLIWFDLICSAGHLCDETAFRCLFNFSRAMHYNAKRRLAITCRLSVRPSVTLVDHDHIGWTSWKLIARTISPNIFAVHSPKVIHPLPGEHGEILGRKFRSTRTSITYVRLNWVNRESRDLKWGCGCLFTFVGASRGHLCDSTAFLFPT